MKTYIRGICVLLPLAASGCSSLIWSRPHAIPVGSTITLNREIRIPDDHFNVHMQDGEIRPYSAIDQYYPNCAIVVRKTAGNYHIIKPDTFRVTDVRYDEMVQGNWSTVASWSYRIARRGMFDGQSFEPYTTIFLLQSDTQPHIYSLECSHWELISDAEHLNLNQIRKAIGNIFTITLKKAAN